MEITVSDEICSKKTYLGLNLGDVFGIEYCGTTVNSSSEDTT